MQRKFFVILCWRFIFCQRISSLSVNIEDTTEVNYVKQHSLNTNFENGSLDPWKDETDEGAEVRWIVEDFWTVGSILRPPPLEPIGSSNRKYLRLERPLGGSFGVAVLRSPLFLCQPGDILTFYYWIRSRYNRLNNLQVFLSRMDGAEELLIDLSASSDITNNNKWNVASQLIPVELPTEITLTFYGFCATDDLDAIAVDDIKITTSEISSTTAIETSPMVSVEPDLTTELLVETSTINESITSGTSQEIIITNTKTDEFTEGTSIVVTAETLETNKETEELTSELTTESNKETTEDITSENTRDLTEKTETISGITESTEQVTKETTIEPSSEISNSPMPDGTTEIPTTGDISETTYFTTDVISSSKVTDEATVGELTTSDVTITSETTEATTDEISISSSITDGTTEVALTTTIEVFTTISETSESITTQEFVSSQVTDEATEGELSTSCTPEATLPSDFRCPNPNAEDALYAAGPCLPYYYRCRCGVATIKDCELEGTFFNPAIRACFVPENILSCGFTAPPTTRPCEATRSTSDGMFR